MKTLTRRAAIAGGAALLAAKAAMAMLPWRHAGPGGAVSGGGSDTWQNAAIGVAPPIAAFSAFTRNLTTGQNLFAFQADSVCPANYAASTTKICTLITAIREAAASSIDLAATTTTVLSNEIVGGTGGQIASGDIISLLDLMYNMILSSANQAAEVLARYFGTANHDRTASVATGRAQFLIMMNAVADELGMVNTTYGSPHGVQYTPGGGTSNNYTTARDLARIATETFYAPATQALSNPSASEICGTLNYTLSITRGGSPITIDIAHSMSFAAGGWDPGILAGKGGNLAATVNGPLSKAVLWQVPGGDKLILTTVATDKTGNSDLDVRGMLYAAMRQFPTLGGTQSDPAISTNSLLIGADTGILDESAFAHTLTANNVTRTTAAIIGTHSLSFNGVDSYITIPDAAEFDFGSSEFQIELWFQGNGSTPTADMCFISHYDTALSQRSWRLYYSNASKLFTLTVSGDGVSAGGTSFSIPATSYDYDVIFNGAPRTLLVRKAAGNLQIYFNGQRGAGVAFGTFFNSSADVVIGAQPNDGAYLIPFAGTLDEIRVRKGGGAATQTASKYLPVPLAFPRS